MKCTLHLLTVLTLYSTQVSAQDWAPFVPGTTHYFSQETEGGLKVDQIQVDTHAFGFSGRYFLHAIPPCQVWDPYGFDGLLKFYREYLPTDKPLYAHVVTGIITFVYLNPARTALQSFDFRHSTRPGTQWVTNHVTIACVSEDEMMVFGEPDSIRTFRCLTAPYDNLEFVLSKSHGLIRFPTLRNFNEAAEDLFGPDYNLIGIHRDSILSKGYQQPKFEDYFNLNPGDVLIWKETDVYYPQMRHDITYLVDSLVVVWQSEDTLRYTTVTKVYDAQANLINTLDRNIYYLREREGALLQGPVGWFTQPVIPLTSFEIFYGFDSLSVRINGGDTMTHATFNSAFSWIDDFFCDVFPIFDYGVTLKYAPKKGLLYEAHYGDNGYYIKELVGSVIDGVEDGETGIPTSVRSVEVSGIAVFPNPTTGLLYIRNPDMQDVLIRISDLQGRLIMADRVDESIDISGLERGIYLCQIFSGRAQEVFTTKIVKH